MTARKPELNFAVTWKPKTTGGGNRGSHSPALDESVIEFVRRTTAASGVPEYVEDPATVALIARLLDGGDVS